MSVADLFAKDCAEKMTENVQLVLRKLSDPSSFVSFKVSGVLADAAMGNMGGLGDYAKKYLEENADVIVMTAARAAGKEAAILGNMNLIFNMMAQAIAAYNDLILLMIKDVARALVKSLRKKVEQNTKLQKQLLQLRGVLAQLSLGDPVFDKYLEQLRAALIELDIGRREMVSVRNTLEVTDRFLSKTYRSGKKRIQAAHEQIQPMKDNSYLKVTANGLARNLGVPTEKEQIHNIMIIPALTREIITTSLAYFADTTRTNVMIDLFYAALGSFQKGMPGFIKRYVINLFDKLIEALKDVVGSMSNTLNGGETTIRWDGNYSPSPLKASLMAYKWSMDMALITERLNLIPAGVVVVPPAVSTASGGLTGNLLGSSSQASTQQGGTLLAAPSGDILSAPADNLFKPVIAGNEVTIVKPASVAGTYRVKEVLSGYQLRLHRFANRTKTQVYGVEFTIVSDALGAMNNTRSVIDVYEQTCADMKRLNSSRAGTAALIASEARENVAVFEPQLLGFLVEVNASFASKPIRKETLALCGSFIGRTKLAIARDQQIINMLTDFINTPIPFEENLRGILDAFHRLMKTLGLDRASDLLATGDIAKFFGLSGRNASYVGAALAALGALRNCFKNDKQQSQVTSVQRQLERRQDLLNVGLTLDFDLSILKNLKACIDLTALANLFSSKESACALLKSTGVGTSLQTLMDKLSF